MENRIPELADEVVHISGLEVGTVIAKYPLVEDTQTVWYLDVRIGDERIRYQTPIENWRVVGDTTGGGRTPSRPSTPVQPPIPPTGPGTR